MATPRISTPEAVIIDKLRNDTIDRAEVFYRNAKNLSDPSTGFEDAGFWSVKALTLMTVYMLAVSKRNAAFAYFGEIFFFLIFFPALPITMAYASDKCKAWPYGQHIH